jgi:uncharacterized membrane protein YfcA
MNTARPGSPNDYRQVRWIAMCIVVLCVIALFLRGYISARVLFWGGLSLAILSLVILLFARVKGTHQRPREIEPLGDILLDKAIDSELRRRDGR